MCLCTLLCWLACVCISRGVAFHSQCKQRVHHPSSFVWGNEGHAVKGRAPPPPSLLSMGKDQWDRRAMSSPASWGLVQCLQRLAQVLLSKHSLMPLFIIASSFIIFITGRENGRNAISLLKGHYMQDFMLFLACLLLWYQLHSHFSGQMNHGLFTDLQHLQDACVVLPQSKTFS